MIPAFPGCAPEQTGRAVFVEKPEDLDEYKTGAGGKVYEIDFPLVFTHANPVDFSAPMDFLDCRFEFTNGGSLHGYGGLPQQLTASTLGLVPFLTFRGHAVIELVTVVGVAIVFDLDGTAAGPTAVANLRNVIAVGCGSIGTWLGYMSIVISETGFNFCGSLTITLTRDVLFQLVSFGLMTGGLVLSGDFGTASFRGVSFTPLDGVTALTVPPTGPSSFADTFDIRLCRFLLDFAGSAGMAIDALTVLEPEGLDVNRGIWTKTGGGDPIGIPIPPGNLDANANEAHFGRCKGVQNSTTVSVITMAGNALATVMAAPNTPVRAALTGVVSQRASKFINSVAGPTIGRVTFDGGIDETVELEFKVTVLGGNNKVISLYFAVGDAVTPAVVALETVQPATTNAGGKAAPVTVGHVVDFIAGDGGFAELWASSADGSSTTIEGFWGASKKLPD